MIPITPGSVEADVELARRALVEYRSRRCSFEGCDIDGDTLRVCICCGHAFCKDHLSPIILLRDNVFSKSSLLRGWLAIPDAPKSIVYYDFIGTDPDTKTEFRALLVRVCDNCFQTEELPSSPFF